MVLPWRRPRRGEDLGDVEAPPRAVIRLADPSLATAAAAAMDPRSSVEGEVRSVETCEDGLRVTLGHLYDRRTALLRRLHALRRSDIEVVDFAWLDPMTDPDDTWLVDSFEHWESGLHRDPDRIEPVEIARRRFGRLQGQHVLDRLLDDVVAPDAEQRRRRTIAHAAVLTGFNTHTTDAGDALVAAALVSAADGYTAMSLLGGALGVAELRQFGIVTEIDEAPLVPLVEHRDWHLHGPATQLLAALAPPRSDGATDVLVRLGNGLAAGSTSTEVRAEQVIAALATSSTDRTDVDDALDALRGHASSAVRVSASTTLAERRPGRARELWEPWLSSRSPNERLAAESMIATWGDERDVPEVARIVEHRIAPPKGMSYWPPLSAEGIEFLSRHASRPEAAATLERVRSRWDRHDDDLRRWLRLHHPELAPEDERD